MLIKSWTIHNLNAKKLVVNRQLARTDITLVVLIAKEPHLGYDTII